MGRKVKSLFIGKIVGSRNKTEGAVFYEYRTCKTRSVAKSSLPAYFKAFDVANCEYIDGVFHANKGWPGIKGYSTYDTRLNVIKQGYSLNVLKKAALKYGCRLGTQEYMESNRPRSVATDISDAVINRLAMVELFTEKDYGEYAKIWNRKALELHKELLTCSKNENQCKEVGILWDYRKDRKIVIRGKEDNIEVGEVAEKFISSSDRYSLVFMHNHPRNLNFSSRDLQSFLLEDHITIITAVCNNGKIHMLRKDTAICGIAIVDVYNKAINEGRSGIDALAKEASRLGISYECSELRRD